MRGRDSLEPVPEPDAIAARVRRWDAEGALGPLTLELYPTLRCNLDCAFCDTTDRHRPPVNELPLSRHLEIVEEAAAMGVRRVFILGGGEPLMARQVTPALMHRVKALGMEGVLTTNGTILPPELVQQLLDDGWDELHVSIDGPSPEIHDALRGQAADPVDAAATLAALIDGLYLRAALNEPEAPGRATEQALRLLAMLRED